MTVDSLDPPGVAGAEDIDQADADFGFMIAARAWTLPNVAAETLMDHLAENLPILVELVPIVVVEPQGPRSAAQPGLVQA